jgi:transcriptional regulator with XRE-family HTH domain
MRLASASFGRRVAEIRLDRGLTQAEIAAAIGVSRQTVTHWETAARCEIEMRGVRKLARVLRVRVDDLRAPAGTPIPFLDPALWSRFKRQRRRHLAVRTPRPRRTPSADEIIFRTVLDAVRNTLDPAGVAVVIRELSAKHGTTLVDTVLKAVQLRLDNERKTFAAACTMPPAPPTADEQPGQLILQLQ